MLTIVTWLWGEKYGEDDVNKLFAGVGRNLKQAHVFVCVTDQPSRIFKHKKQIDYWWSPILDSELLSERGCFARLRLFDPEWQQAGLGAMAGDRIVNVDLDTVITGPLDPLFDRPEPFVILQGANAANPCPYNGSLMMLRAGAHPEVWTDFSLDAAQKIPFHEFPDDQGWIAHKIPDAAGWQAGSASGVYAFCKPGWPPDHNDRTKNGLPAGARMVTFPGWRSPEKCMHLAWVKKHWR